MINLLFALLESKKRKENQKQKKNDGKEKQIQERTNAESNDRKAIQSISSKQNQLTNFPRIIETLRLKMENHPFAGDGDVTQ